MFAVPCDPGPADDQPPACADFIDDGCVDVTAVDVERVDGAPLRLDSLDEGGCGVLFRTIGRQNRDCQDEDGIEIDREMALVAIEALGLGLATVPHLLVLDRHAAILGNTLANPRWRSAWVVGIWLKILLDDLM